MPNVLAADRPVALRDRAHAQASARARLGRSSAVLHVPAGRPRVDLKLWVFYQNEEQAGRGNCALSGSRSIDVWVWDRRGLLKLAEEPVWLLRAGIGWVLRAHLCCGLASAPAGAGEGQAASARLPGGGRMGGGSCRRSRRRPQTGQVKWTGAGSWGRRADREGGCSGSRLAARSARRLWALRSSAVFTLE